MTPALPARLSALALLATLAACTPSPSLPPGQLQVLPQLPPGRVEAGARRAQWRDPASGQRCVDCHGRDGATPLQPDYPRLAGQYPDYLAHALLSYRSGARRDTDMAAQAARLSDQDIADLAAWFGTRPGELHELAPSH